MALHETTASPSRRLAAAAASGIGRRKRHAALPDAATLPKARDVNAFIAARFMAARRISGLSQMEVGRALGVTFQQVQRYERGRNHIHPGQLARFAALVGQPVAAFFPPGAAAAASPDPATLLLATPGGLDVARGFVALKHKFQRDAVAFVIDSLNRGER